MEAYIHRSGRTGRAGTVKIVKIYPLLDNCILTSLLTLSYCSGNTGVAVLLYEPKKAYTISKIERESGVKFEHISAPQPAEIARSAGLEAAEIISNVSDRYSQFQYLT